MNNHFTRFSRRKHRRNLWDSSSDDSLSSDTDDQTQDDNNIKETCHNSSANQSNTNRLTLLAAFPSLHSNGVVVYRGCEHLLLANTPQHQLINEQRQERERQYSFQSFTLTDQRQETNLIPSFFLNLYQQLFGDLLRRLRIAQTILDYNYERLLKCIAIMTDERIRFRFGTLSMIHIEQLSINEYALALEFYLQFDVKLFHMKTCIFRGARPSSSVQRFGLFAHEEAKSPYGIIACQRRSCRFCFPSPSIIAIRHDDRNQYESVLKFSSAQKHRFVNGYEAILNCPTSCRTKNIIYTLTCPCGQFDYVGYTSMTLSQRLYYHRKHGNRILREFLLGSKNIRRLDDENKVHEDLIKDGMLLYRHSARCSRAMQWFLNCNPEFWHFVPMKKDEARRDNEIYILPSSIPSDPISTVVTKQHQRSDFETGLCLTDLPPLPSDQYTFSTRQCAEQFQIFQNTQNRLLPNNNLDLYNATIVAVLPEHCSAAFQRLIEALFITHAETKLNIIGHLDGSMTTDNYHPNGMTPTRMIADRGQWCADLNRPSS